MNGFGGDAEAARFNLAAARDVVDGDKMNGCGLTEADLRLQDRENNLRVREEALDRLERQMQQQLQEEEVSRQDNLRKRSEVLSRLEKQLQQIREDAVKYREEAQVDRKKLSDKMTQLESLERSMKIREEALRTRQEEAQRKKKNDNTWNMGQIVSMLALISGLTLLIQIRTLFPHDYLNHIIDAFVILWTLASTTFLCGVFGTSRTAKIFSHRVERLIYICFLLFVMYALYLISWPVDGTFPCASPASASMSASTTVGRSILVKIIGMAKDTISWVLAYASGEGDKNVGTAP